MVLATVSLLSPWGQVVIAEGTLDDDVMGFQVYRRVENLTAYICWEAQ